MNSSLENQHAKSVDVSCMGGWESESTVAEGTVSFAFPPTSPSHRAEGVIGLQARSLLCRSRPVEHERLPSRNLWHPRAKDE